MHRLIFAPFRTSLVRFLTERIAEQREQSRERTSLKERIEANKRIVAEREREKEKSRQHNRGMSR